MKKDISFNVEFNYALSEDIIIRLTADVQLTHSTPHYIISNFHFKNNPGGNALLNDINIMAIKDEKGITWVHTDSQKSTMLSLAIGKAIEEKDLVEIAIS